jgi:hypothetical protein
VTLLKEKFSFQRLIETNKMRLKKKRPCWRSEEALIATLSRAGFMVDLVEPTAPGREETWFIASAID